MPDEVSAGKLFEMLVAQRSDQASYHNHKENNVHLAFAVSLTSVPAYLEFSTLSLCWLLIPLLILGVIALHFFMLTQDNLRKTAAKRVQAIDATLFLLAAHPALTSDDLALVKPTLQRSPVSAVQAAIGIGYNGVRKVLQSTAVPRFLAQQYEAHLSYNPPDNPRDLWLKLGQAKAAGILLANAAILAMLIALALQSLITKLIHLLL